ncbi:MAG: AAA family ATPase [Nanoarchaeales archaeon]|nr:AAA family ATPase [Nanoarchaeales archaeon]
MNVLITGIAGCGKSTVATKLKELGYESYDIESIDGLFGMYDKDTKKPTKNYSNESLEIIKQNEWICDASKLKKLIDKNNSDKITFYCGMASNLYELLPLFDIKVLLVADKNTTLKRLKMRTEVYEYGHTHEVQQDILSWKDNWENETLKKGLIKIDSSKPLEKVINNILSIKELE